MAERAVVTEPDGVVNRGDPERRRSGESIALVFLAMAAFLILCLASYDPRDPSFNVATTRHEISNLCGLVGSHLADALVQLLGFGSFILPVGLIVLAVRTFVPPRSRVRWSEIGGVGAALVGTSALLERFASESFLNLSPEHPGGALGNAFHEILFRLVGSAGEVLLCGTLILLCFLHLMKVSLKDAAEIGARMADPVSRILWSAPVAATAWWQEHRSVRPQQHEEAPPVQPRSGVRIVPRNDLVPNAAKAVVNPALDLDSSQAHSWERISFLPGHDDDGLFEGTPVATRRGFPPRKSREDVSVPERAPVVDPPPWRPVEMAEQESSGESACVTEEELEDAIEAFLKDAPPKRSPKTRRKPKSADREEDREEDSGRPIKVTRRADEEISRHPSRHTGSQGRDDYQLPPLDLLQMPPTANRAIDERVLEANAMVLEQKLSDLGIRGEVVEVHPGPVITMYELILAPGIPLRKILNTSDDLAMALKSGSTRVVAPIPGKDTVGIEVPNLNREIVYFREIIESPAFTTSVAPLKVALGKCIDGQPFASSLAKMPHLLIAGATGTGKSVGLNCLICSWLMSCHPDDLKLIMVDPKKLELSYYQDIPHLLHPVVTDPEKVPKVLSWAIREMERRYDLLSGTGAKNIESYNNKVLSGEVPPDAAGSPPKKLPYLIIIVDELAELMMVAAKDIEISIARLAQMARAAGIHLILATQRPSVDVITGVIKANFPARISFQVSAKPDSRTILDTVGAENLLGMGDMLFLPPGAAKLIRLHGAFLSEEEIRRVVDFIKVQREPVYLQEIAKHVSEDEVKPSAAELISDEKYDEAVELVSRLGHASISLIQRHMRIGYNRAARIIEAMEAEGLIGPSDGTSRPREVLARSLEAIPDGG